MLLQQVGQASGGSDVAGTKQHNSPIVQWGLNAAANRCDSVVSVGDDRVGPLYQKAPLRQLVHKGRRTEALVVGSGGHRAGRFEQDQDDVTPLGSGGHEARLRRWRRCPLGHRIGSKVRELFALGHRDSGYYHVDYEIPGKRPTPKTRSQETSATRTSSPSRQPRHWVTRRVTRRGPTTA